MRETIKDIPSGELHPFPDRPFGVRDDESMEQAVESVREYGVLVPTIARPRECGGYELIAGHRRKHACELAGLKTMPVIVRDIDRNTATMPYPTEALNLNMQSYQAYYDEINVYNPDEKIYPKAARQSRNPNIVDRSDLVWFRCRT